MQAYYRRIPPDALAVAGLVAIVATGLVWLLSRVLITGTDWVIFYNAAHHLLAGQSPFIDRQYANPPWALLPVLPFALLPENVGRAAWLVFSFAVFAWVAYRAGARPLAMGLFLSSPLTVGCLLTGNMDWVPLLGFMLPPQIGLPIVLIKPHIGIAIAVYWVVNAYRQGRLRQVFRLVYPTVLIYLASFVVYGLWLTNSMSILEDSHGRWNISLFPYSIPVGVALLAIGIFRQKAEWTWGASPLLSPYASFNVFNGLPLAIIKKPWLLGALVVAMWFAVWLIR